MGEECDAKRAAVEDPEFYGQFCCDEPPRVANTVKAVPLEVVQVVPRAALASGVTEKGDEQ